MWFTLCDLLSGVKAALEGGLEDKGVAVRRRKFFSVARKAEAAHLFTIAPSRQRPTRRVRIRTPEQGLSIRFVLTRQRRRAGGRAKRLTVKISSRPSKRLAAASGCDLKPPGLLAQTQSPPSAPAARPPSSSPSPGPSTPRAGGPSRSSPCGCGTAAPDCRPRTLRSIAARSALEPSMTKSRRRPGRTPRSTNSSAARLSAWREKCRHDRGGSVAPDLRAQNGFWPRVSTPRPAATMT